MKISWITVPVKNMEDALKFYTEIVGLPVNRRFQAGPGIEIAFLGKRETELELICDKNKAPESKGDLSIGFEVNSVDEKLKFLETKNIPLHSGPFQPNPKIRFFFVTDPDGLKVQFFENL
jgi:lactoylglutathione lyase